MILVYLNTLAGEALFLKVVFCINISNVLLEILVGLV